MTRLILVRHGQSTANVDFIFAGHKDEALTQMGHTQAEKTAQYIKENYKVDAIYSSDLIRAYDTAKHMAERFALPVITDTGLREIYAAKWQGLSYDDILKNYAQAYTVWLKDIGNAQCTEGESVRELSERVCGAVERIAKENDGKTVLIVTHATPIRALQCNWSGKTLDEMKDVPWVPNSSVTVAEYQEGAYYITQCGVDDYLNELKSQFPANV